MKKNYSVMGRHVTVLLAAVVSLCFSVSTQAQPIVNTIAGDGTPAYNGEGAPAITKELNNPFSVAVDPSGNVYIADAYNHRIRKVTPAGVISTVAGTGTNIPGYNGEGVATACNLNYPYGVAIDAAGNLLIADQGNCRIRKVTPGGTISTIAGSLPGYSGDGTAAVGAMLSNPSGVAVDAVGNVYIADYGNNVIRKINTAGIINTIAGNGTAGYSGDGGPAITAQLQNPYGVAVDASGNVFIADWYNQAVRKVTTLGAISSILTSIPRPGGVCTDAAGNIYVGAGSVYKITPSGTSSIIAGTGVAGFSGDGSLPLLAQFNNPSGLAVTASGDIYIADLANHRVRSITNPVIVISPIAGNLALCIGGSTTLSDPSGGGTWNSGTPSVASIDVTTGLVNAISAGTSQITYTNATGSAYATVTVDPFPNVGKILGLNMLCPGLTAILADGIPGGIWTSSDPSVVAIASSGIVTAIAPGKANIYYTVSSACGASGSAKYPFTVLTHADCLAGVTATNIADEPGSIKAWPNPSEGTFTIKLSSSIDEEVWVTVTNVVGEKVRELTTTTNTEIKIKLDAASGLYFLNAIADHGRWSQKVLVNASGTH